MKKYLEAKQLGSEAAEELAARQLGGWEAKKLEAGKLGSEAAGEKAARQLGSWAAKKLAAGEMAAGEMAAKRLSGWAAKSLGFTLAEVLITIAIIGVVAALTIPVIMTKYQEKKIEAAVDVFKTKILDTAGVMYAKGELDGTTSANFINKLGHYMKLTKTCDSSHLSDCFPSTIINGDKEISIDNLKTPSSLGVSYTNDNNVGGIMADGTKFILSFDPNCSISNYSTAVASCMHMVADLPISSNNNIVGEDILTYNAELDNGGLTVGDLMNSISSCSLSSGRVVCEGYFVVPAILEDYWSSRVVPAGETLYCSCKNNDCSNSKSVITGCADRMHTGNE